MTIQAQQYFKAFDGAVGLPPETLKCMRACAIDPKERWTVYFNYNQPSLYIGDNEDSRYLHDPEGYLQFEGVTLTNQNSHVELGLARCTIIYHSFQGNMPETGHDQLLKQKLLKLFNEVFGKY